MTTMEQLYREMHAANELLQGATVNEWYRRASWDAFGDGYELVHGQLVYHAHTPYRGTPAPLLPEFEASGIHLDLAHWSVAPCNKGPKNDTEFDAVP
jgi:hypothetical protein